MKVYTTDKLAEYAGKNGRAVLVAVDGKVYDLSASKKWGDGNHMRRHSAGADLSTDINSAPHGREVLERFEVVGGFDEVLSGAPPGTRGQIETWLNKHPFFRRHPHPAIVHVPVGLMAVLPFLEIAGLVFQSGRTEWAAFCCLLMAILAIPAALATGYFTWWINYEARDFPTVRKKRQLAWASLILGILVIVLRSALIFDPLDIEQPYVIAYLVGIFALAVLVGFTGFLGGKLTFPYESH
ncbi:MAG: DUF2231 domain-containing protein [Pseudomonadota bacterium]